MDRADAIILDRDDANIFESNRPPLLALAYRMVADPARADALNRRSPRASSVANGSSTANPRSSDCSTAVAGVDAEATRILRGHCIARPRRCC
jgi:hypothetical protein